jgi:hypothetical protein
MKICPLKSKVMAFKGQFPIRTKLLRGNTILKQGYTFTYLGHKILFREEKGITSKMSKFSKLWGR